MVERPSAIERLSGGVLGFGVGAAIGCLVPVTPVGVWEDLIPPILVAGTVGTLLGVALAPRIPMPAPAGAPSAIPRDPVPIGALGAEFGRRMARGSQTSLRLAVGVGLGALPLALIAYAMVGTLPSILVLGLVAAAGFVAAVACATILPPFLAPPGIRSALAASVWQGARAFERAFGSRYAVRGFPSTAEQARRWLATHAETDATRGIRVELHAMRGEWDAARATLERMPSSTPRERFARAILEAVIVYQAGGEADDAAAGAAARAIPPGRDRTEALISIAAFEARRQLPDGEWSRPLLAARGAIPESDARILFRDLGWVSFVTVARRVAPAMVLIAALVLGPVILSLIR